MGTGEGETAQQHAGEAAGATDTEQIEGQEAPPPAPPPIPVEQLRWGPVAEALGAGSAICGGSDGVLCAVVLCRDGALSLGVIGTGDAAEQPPFKGRVEIDGETFRREMSSVQLGDGVLHVGTPVSAGDPLWARMRAGRAVRIFDAAGEQAREFSLRGSAAELDRVAAACR